MAPVVSKIVAKPRPSQSQDLLALATKRVKPALDELLAALGTLAQESIEECRHALLQVGAVVDHVVRTSGDVLCRCYPCSLHRFLQSSDQPLQGSLPVFFVLQIIVMLYNAFVFCYMPAAGLALNSPTSLIFHAFIFLVLSSMAKAMWTDPGTAPSTEEWRSFGRPPKEATERKRSTGEARWCQNSHVYKPDRAHYCRGSSRVVLRMDHYCPWLRNTIGFANHKYFFLFLLYTNAMCSFLGISFLQLLVHVTLPALSTFLIIGAEGLTLLLFSILGPFFLFHCYLLARNMTTIEFCGLQDGGHSPYDLGIFRNLCSVLGENPLLWWVPWGGPTGNGVTFAKKPSCPEATDNAVDSADSQVQDLEAAASSGLTGGTETTTIAEAVDKEEAFTSESSAQHMSPDIDVQSQASAASPETACPGEAHHSLEAMPLSEVGGTLESPSVDEAAGASCSSSIGAAKTPPAENSKVPCRSGTADQEAISRTDAFMSSVTSCSAWKFVAEVPDDLKVGCHALSEGAQALGMFAQGTLGDAVSRFSSMCTISKKRPSKADSGNAKRSSKLSRKSKKPLLSDAGTSDVSTAASEKRTVTSESDQTSTRAFSIGPASGSDWGN